MLFTSISFAQQDSTKMDNRSKSPKKHKNTTSYPNDANRKDTVKMKHSDKKGGNHNNMDSTATMGR
jgi:hypothetical protein